MPDLPPFGAVFTWLCAAIAIIAEIPTIPIAIVLTAFMLVYFLSASR
jgi:hypothetical protein